MNTKILLFVIVFMLLVPTTVSIGGSLKQDTEIGSKPSKKLIPDLPYIMAEQHHGEHPHHETEHHYNFEFVPDCRLRRLCISAVKILVVLIYLLMLPWSMNTPHVMVYSNIQVVSPVNL